MRRWQRPHPWLASRALVAGVLGYSFYVIARQWRVDLVEPRRRMRVAVTVIICGYILAVVVVDSRMVGEMVPQWLEVANSAGILVSTLFFIALLTLMGPAELETENSTDAPKTNPVAISDQREIDSIVATIEQQHAYREMELTIRARGSMLSIPEHRLRQHINRGLNYRNFNDFLNRYRVVMVC